MEKRQQSYENISVACFIIGSIYLAVAALSGSQLLLQAVAFYIVGISTWPCLAPNVPRAPAE